MLIAALLSYLQYRGQQVEATGSVKAHDVLQGDLRRAYFACNLQFTLHEELYQISPINICCQTLVGQLHFLQFFYVSFYKISEDTRLMGAQHGKTN